MKFNSGLDQSTFMVSSYCRSSIKSTVYTILKVSFLSFISLPALYERQKQKLLMSNFASMCGVLQLFMQHDKASSWHWWLYNGHHSDRKAVVRGWMAGTLCLLPLLLPLCISEYSTTVSIFNCRFLLHNSVCIIWKWFNASSYAKPHRNCARWVFWIAARHIYADHSQSLTLCSLKSHRGNPLALCQHAVADSWVRGFFSFVLLFYS